MTSETTSPGDGERGEGGGAMDADQARDLFSAAYDGELTADDQRGFDAALKADAGLNAEWLEFRDLLNEAHALDDDEGLADAAPDLLAGVQHKIRARSRGRFYKDRFAQSPGGGLLPILIAGVMLLVLAVAWVMLHYVEFEPQSRGDHGAAQPYAQLEAPAPRPAAPPAARADTPRV